MATINVNTAKMIDCGNDIIKKTTECNNLLTEIFNELANLNKTSWSGSTADKYVEQVRIQRVQYKNLTNSLINYGNIIKNAGYKLENNMRKWN